MTKNYDEAQFESAIEALRDVIDRGLCKINEFTPNAKIARVQKVMRPAFIG